MEEHLLYGSILAALLGFVLAYALFFKRNGVFNEAEKSANTTTAVARECGSRNGYGDDADVIIVGAGVAGAALAHTLGKV